jgi:phospholipase C
VPHTVYDHTSVLALIEWRWGLKPLTMRDRTANNLAAALDFNHPDPTAPQFDVPPGPFGAPCPVGSTTHDEEWTALQGLARSYGWSVG